MFADKTYDGKDDKGFSHLDHDGDFLVSGASHGEVIAWDFKSGKRLYKVQSKQCLVALRVKWPIVLTSAVEYETRGGAKMYDMPNESLIRTITFDDCTDVNFMGNAIMVCGVRRYKFWDLAQLKDMTKDMDKVAHFSITSESDFGNHPVCATVKVFKG